MGVAAAAAVLLLRSCSVPATYHSSDARRYSSDTQRRAAASHATGDQSDHVVSRFLARWGGAAASRAGWMGGGGGRARGRKALPAMRRRGRGGGEKPATGRTTVNVGGRYHCFLHKNVCMTSSYNILTSHIYLMYSFSAHDFIDNSDGFIKDIILNYTLFEPYNQ